MHDIKTKYKVVLTPLAVAKRSGATYRSFYINHLVAAIPILIKWAMDAEHYKIHITKRKEATSNGKDEREAEGSIGSE